MKKLCSLLSLFVMVCSAYGALVVPPSNDLCANAIQLTPGLTCSYTTGTYSGALKDGGDVGCASNSIQDVWYKFTATDATMSVSLGYQTGSNHALQILQGGCGGAVVSCVNGSGLDQGETYMSGNFIPGQEYYVRVMNAGGFLSTSNLRICVTSYPAPANDLCANAIQLTPGLTCTYTTGTYSGALKDGGDVGCASNALQDVWYKFTATDATMSVSLGYQTGSNHALQILQGGCGGAVVTCVNSSGLDQGETYMSGNFIPGQEYYVRVMNAGGFLSTSNLRICVTSYPAPANDLCANAIQLTSGLTCSYTTSTYSGALKDGGDVGCASNSIQDVWYKFTATDATMSVSLGYQTGSNHALQILQGGCGGAVVSCVNGSGLDQGETYMSGNFIPGQEYYVRVMNAGGFLSTSNLRICVTSYPAPANDLCANAIQLTPGLTCTYTTGTYSGALKDGGDVGCASNALQDVWYKFTATDATMSVSLGYQTGSNHALQILQGGCGGAVVTCVNSSGLDQGETYMSGNFIPGQEYYVRVMNAGGFLSTSNLRICVTSYPAPANDLCANAIQLTPGTTCTYTTGTYSGALKDGGDVGCASNSIQDVWYKFTATDATMSVSLGYQTGSNHALQILQGGCGGAVVTCVNSSGLDQGETYMSGNFIPGQEYYVRVMNAGGFLSTSNLRICVTSYPAPANDLCANAIQLTPGTGCTYITGNFTGSMLDGAMPACATAAQQDVWYKFTATDVTNSITLDIISGLNHGFEVLQGGCNGTVIACVNSGAAGAYESYYSNNFVPGQEYYIRVFNAANTASSSNFRICVRKYPTPANDLCINATEVFPGESCSYVGGTFIGATNDGPSTACPTSAVSQDIWYKFTATEQTYSIYLNPVSFFNPGFQIFEGSCSGQVMACVNDFGSNSSEYYISNNFIIGQTYYIRFFHAMNGYSSDNITFCITKYPKPANDTCATATLLYQNTTCTSVGATFSGAMLDGAAISCAPQAGQDVWFRFIAEGNAANINLGPMSGRDLGFQVYQGGCSGTAISCTNANGVNLSETGYVSNLIQGQEYYIRVFNVYQGLTTGNFSICVYGSVQPCTASVSIAASATQVCSSSSVTFTALPVNGGVTPQYQWKRNGNNVGTNSPVFTASNLNNGDIINVVMTSSALCPTAPTVTSNVIQISVTLPTMPLFNQIAPVCNGGIISLPTTSSNGVMGSWSPAVNNTATTTYTFTPADGQCATMAAMTVQVIVIDPTVTAQGSTITATTAGAMYQWIDCTTGEPIPDASTRSFTATVNGSYAVVIVQDNCSVTSECFEITSLGLEPRENVMWKIYPNPAGELLNLTVNNDMVIEIIDMMGKTISRLSLASGINRIDVSQLDMGVYMIKSENGFYAKFVKK